MRGDGPDVARYGDPTDDQASPRLPPGVVPAEADEVDVGDLLGVLARRWGLMAITLVVTVGAVAVWTWLTPPVFRAEALILTDSGAGSMTGATSLLRFVDMGLPVSRSTQTQVEIIRSPAVAGAALASMPEKYRPYLSSDPEEAVDVGEHRDTDIISIAAVSTSRQAAAALANAVGERYLQFGEEESRRQVRAATDYISRKLDQVRADLEAAQRNVRSFKETNQTVDLRAEASGFTGQLVQIGAEIRTTKGNLAAARADLESRTEKEVRVGGRRLTERELTDNPVTADIRKRLLDLRMQETQALLEYTPTSPEVQRVRTQIAAAQRELEDNLAVAIAQNVAPAQAKVWGLEAALTALRRADAEVRAQLSSLPEKEYQFAQLQTEVELLGQTFRTLSDQYQRLRIAEESQLSGAQVVSAAGVPDSPIGPRKKVNLALGMLIGLALALAFALLADRLDQRFYTDEAVEAMLGAPVLASIPVLRSDEPSRVEEAAERSALLEIFRALRGNIAYLRPDHPPRSILITSSNPEEGKSLVAANLAVALAMQGKRVTLVDADLRRPSLHERFGLSGEVGLSSVVAGSASIAHALQETAVPGLKLLPCGPPPPHAAEMLTSERWRACLEELVAQADVVLLDSSPVPLFADTRALAHQAEGTLLVMSMREARRPGVAESVRLLALVGADMLGVVLNHVETGRRMRHLYSAYRTGA